MQSFGCKGKVGVKNRNLSSKQQPSETEKELTRTQEYLETIFSNMPAGIAIMEGPEFRYVKVNNRLAEINGLSVEDHLGRPLAEVLPAAAADIGPRLRQVMETGESSSPFEFSTSLPKSPDEVFWFVDRFFPINDTNGEVRGVGAVVLEVTARKRAEIALQEAYGELEQRVQKRTQQLLDSEKRLETMIERAPDSIVYVTRDGTIDLVNQQTEEIFGYDQGELIGQPLELLLPERFRNQHRQHQTGFFNDPRVRPMGSDLDLYGRRKDGSEFPVEISLSFMELEKGRVGCATIRDVTERREAETKMKITQDRLSSALDGIPGGLWDWNVVTGAVYFSDKWCESLGYQPEEVDPHVSFWEQIVHPDDLSRVMEQVEAHFRGETEVYQCENRLRTKSGNYRWNLDRGQVVSWSADGKPLRMVGVDLDINERREAQEKLEKTQKELLSLSKHLIQAQETERRRISLELHDQLGQDLALMSIELEELIQRAPESPAQPTEGLHKLALQARKLSSQVQTLSRQLHPAQLTHLGLVAASRSLCNEVSKASGIQIDFSHSDIPKSIPPGVSICLYRVLQESLGNMVKHSGTQEAQVNLTGRPDEIQLHVCDSGVGFDPEGHRETFGLGLISMRERVHLVGGELLIESQPSRGTRIKASVSF
ncbi:MAG: PAS domain S-box protein [Acidobacteria bacterium]|nr:PAS domain S-box protein [Acidobacteriota bacterium]MCZ6879248.1 PAS domain S-box protein [Acidobacteriota bacterium]